MNKGYDERSPKSIESYGQKMIGKTFGEICLDDEQNCSMVMDGANYAKEHENKKRKGGLGEIIEERFFHYTCNNDSRPDFPDAGVELKVTPYKINSKGQLSAKERLIITMIDYFKVVEESFENSHVWNKSRLILLVYYLYNKEIANRLDYRIDYVKLFSPPEQDLKIIEHDYNVIVDKIKAGKAHELSEGDTLYLGAATKAATSEDRREQPFSSELAKPRAFAFKNSYMTYVLNNYIVPRSITKEQIIAYCTEESSADCDDNRIHECQSDVLTEELKYLESDCISGSVKCDSIIKGDTLESFEDYVVGKINAYQGYTVQALCNEFEVSLEKKPKNLEAMLAYRMLGIKGNKAEEFEKANVVVKTIRIGKNNKIKESMSFPTFKFKELIEETWEDSTFGNYLRETRFLFVVYKFDSNDELRLKGCQFWNIPYGDLEGNVKKVWEETKNVLINGLEIRVENGKRYNNFPKATSNPVSHVRPHAKNAQDTYELPDGRRYPKQCFWLNNSYIYMQLDERFKGD